MMLRIASSEEADLSGPPGSWILVGGKSRRITREDEILEIALGLAADRGDSSPALVQHVRCSRAEANRLASGSIVPGVGESYLIVDVATGAPTDSGVCNEYPDLAVVGCVVTDHPR
jgi:hypothetical protein